MRSKFSRWGLSVLTMVSVATVLLFVTGWGSAIASSVSSVIVTNTASHPVPVNGTVTVSGTPSVNVGNLATDTNGNLKVAEQGVPTVHVNNTDASGNLKVVEQGTPNVHVENFPSSQTVNGSVSVSNLPAAPTTVVIASGSGTVFPSGSGFAGPGLVPLTDVSMYREVTFDAEAMGAGSGVHCNPELQAGSALFDAPSFFVANGSPEVSTTYDAPVKIEIGCENFDVGDIDLTWALVGRTG